MPVRAHALIYSFTTITIFVYFYWYLISAYICTYLPTLAGMLNRKKTALLLMERQLICNNFSVRLHGKLNLYFFCIGIVIDIYLPGPFQMFRMSGIVYQQNSSA